MQRKPRGHRNPAARPRAVSRRCITSAVRKKLTHSELIAALLQHEQDKRDEELRTEFGPGWEGAGHNDLIYEFRRRTSERLGEVILEPVDEED